MRDELPAGVVAQRVAVFDPVAEQIIAARNARQPGPIASVQKLLTALLVAEAGALDQLVEIHPEDTLCQPANAGLRPGASYRRRDLLAAMLIGSANDAAMALARDHSSDLTVFAEAMTTRAHRLGMTESLFLNPHGLPHDGQVSTAADAAILAAAVDGVTEIRRLVATHEFAIGHADGSTTAMRNTNRLLGSLAACDGMKTGFTRASGHCLVATGTAGGTRRIVVVLNSTSDAVWHDARLLLDWSLGLSPSVVPHVSV